MARPTKQGLDYFPFDVGFFGDDDRIRNLKLRYHANGLIVYVRILCDVYKEGYYLPVKRWEDYVLGLADEFKMSTNAVEQVITFLRTRALLRVFRKGKDDLSGFDGDAVITSHGIQLRYAEAVKNNRKRSVEEVRRDFWLLSEDEEAKIFTSCKSRNNDNKSPINPNKSPINPNKSPINSTKESKVNESKLKEINVNETITLTPTKSNDIDNCTDIQEKSEGKKEAEKCSHIVLPPPAGIRSAEEQEQHDRAKKELLRMCPQWVNASKKVDDTPIESYVKLLDAVKKSTFLQGFGSFKWIVNHYSAIIEDAYIDYAKAELNTNDSASTPSKLPPIIQAINDRADRERFYARRREKVEREKDRAYQKALKSSVEFACAEQEIRKMQLEIAKAELNDVDLARELKEKEEALKRARIYALKKIGLTLEDIEGKPYCSKCADTGTLPNGRACDCYQKEKEIEK